MGYCVRCGAMVNDGVNYCPECGEKIPEVQGYTSAETQIEYSQEYTYGTDNNGQEYAYGTDNNGQEYTYEDAGYSRNQGYTTQKEYFPADEVNANKAMGVLSYLGILVLIPLLAGDRNSQYVKFHVNQGLVLYIVDTIADILSGEWILSHHFAEYFAGITSWVFDLVGVAVFIMMILGIMAAVKGEKKELPFIGQIKIWK